MSTVRRQVRHDMEARLQHGKHRKVESRLWNVESLKLHVQIGHEGHFNMKIKSVELDNALFSPVDQGWLYRVQQYANDRLIKSV